MRSPLLDIKIVKYVNRNVLGFVRELWTYIQGLFRSRDPHQVKFIMFGRGRSGSTLLSSMLNSNPDICCDSEILNRLVLFPRLFLLVRAKLFRKNTYGVKVISSQLRSIQRLKDPEAFMRNLNDRGFKIIYLVRQNRLRQIISRTYAEKTAIWHNRGNEKAGGKIRVDIDTLRANMAESKRLDAYEEQLLGQIPHLKITYELDLENSDNHQQCINKICKFLNISSFSPKTTLKKITASRLEEFIENYDEVEELIDE